MRLIIIYSDFVACVFRSAHLKFPFFLFFSPFLFPSPFFFFSPLLSFFAPFLLLFFSPLSLPSPPFLPFLPSPLSLLFSSSPPLPSLSSDYFGESLSTRQIQDLAKDITLIFRTVLKDAAQLDKAADKCRMIAADLRLLFPDTPQRGNWAEALTRDDVRLQVGKLAEALGVLHEVCKLHIGRDKDLDNLYERVVEAREQLDALSNDKQENVSLWYETTNRHLIMHLTPLSIAAKFRRFVTSPPRGWVFTSATLMVNGGFEHFQRRMGLEDAHTLGLDSPFNYPEQAMLCVPRYLPEPNSFSMRETLLNTAKRLIKASKGRCFLLFTSHAMLREIAGKLEDEIDNPFLVPGTSTKKAFLEA